MADFDKAIAYILGNEGIDSNDPHDHGGRTRYGITAAEAIANGLDVTVLNLDQAKAIYRRDYWKFGGVRDQRVATKMLDMAVNMGIAGAVKLIQRAVGTREDGVYGAGTEAAVNAHDPEEVLEKLSLTSADRYVDICLHNNSQLVFLKGWIRRAIRRPKGV